MYASSFNLVKSSGALEFGQPPSRFFSPYGCKILSCTASLPKLDAMPQQGERADVTLVNNQCQRRRQEGMERDDDVVQSHPQKFRDWLSMTDDEFKREAAVLRKISRISSLLPTEEWKDFCVRRAQLIKDASKAVAMLYKDIDLVERLRILRERAAGQFSSGFRNIPGFPSYFKDQDSKVIYLPIMERVGLDANGLVYMAQIGSNNEVASMYGEIYAQLLTKPFEFVIPWGAVFEFGSTLLSDDTEIKGVEMMKDFGNKTERAKQKQLARNKEIRKRKIRELFQAWSWMELVVGTEEGWQGPEHVLDLFCRAPIQWYDARNVCDCAGNIIIFFTEDMGHLQPMRCEKGDNTWHTVLPCHVIGCTVNGY